MQGTMIQPTSQQQQLPTFMTPPSVVTTKDILYLEDAMSWLLLAVKKCSHFANEVQCQQIKQAIDKVGQMHQRQYNLILKHCQNNNTMQMAQVQQKQSTSQTIQ